ncbi:hypothetical protein [Lacrimispora sp.]|uniref:hypothetical protein n=1 Tax=Lacrimispora sp. TaxID=2719234 RepID=UPI0028A77D85|nr:hypothetical protein [Lacrimispora sp.]
MAYIDKSSDRSGIFCVSATLIPIVPVWGKAKEYTDISRLYDIFLHDAFDSDYSGYKKGEKDRRTNYYSERNRITKEE